MRDEFDRQLERLAALGYPRTAVQSLQALAVRLDELSPTVDPARTPFVVVVSHAALATGAALPLAGGFVGMEPTEPEEYEPIPEIAVPAGVGYLVLDVDTGGDMLNVTPNDALAAILAAGRTPLTIDEAVAVLTHFPEVLRARNAFSILGSRRGDKRVPALWQSRGRPRLGWCWAGNPHTWLGSASCGGRLGLG